MGVVFLDEIGEIDVSAQQEKPLKGQKSILKTIGISLQGLQDTVTILLISHLISRMKS